MTSEDHPHTLLSACLASLTCHCPSGTTGSMETCTASQSFVVHRRPGVTVVIQGFDPSFSSSSGPDYTAKEKEINFTRCNLFVF